MKYSFSFIISLIILLGAGCTQSKVSVDFVQQKNVTSNAYFVMAEGAVFRGNEDLGGVDVVRVDCDLQNEICVQNGFGLTKHASAILYNSKTYSIVEASASRIVGEYQGLAQTHHVEINLLTKEVTFTETDSGSSDTRAFELEDGSSALAKMNE